MGAILCARQTTTAFSTARGRPLNGALRPDLVRPEAVDIVPEEPHFKQSDLNTFGMGWNAPQGAHGWPSAGSREKGERIVASIKVDMVAHVTERLDWLARNRTYGGQNMRER